MSAEDSALEGRTQAILLMPAIQKVNFIFGKYKVSTTGYTTVSGCIRDSKIHCRVDTSKLEEGEAAIYKSLENTIYGKDSRLQNNEDMVTLVHEATHAWFDVQKLKMLRLDNETCAFLAGAMFSEAIKKPIKGVKVTENPGANDIRGQALVLVQAKGLGSGASNADAPLTFTVQEVAPLQAAIKASPIYQKEYKKVDNLDGVD